MGSRAECSTVNFCAAPGRRATAPARCGLSAYGGEELLAHAVVWDNQSFDRQAGVAGGLFFNNSAPGDYFPLFSVPLRPPVGGEVRKWSVRVDVAGLWHSTDSDLLVLLYDGARYVGAERGDNGAWFHGAEAKQGEMGTDSLPRAEDMGAIFPAYPNVGGRSPSFTVVWHVLFLEILGPGIVGSSRDP